MTLQGAEDFADEMAIVIVEDWLRKHQAVVTGLTNSSLDDLANAIADTIREVVEG